MNKINIKVAKLFAWFCLFGQLLKRKYRSASGEDLQNLIVNVTSFLVLEQKLIIAPVIQSAYKWLKQCLVKLFWSYILPWESSSWKCLSKNWFFGRIQGRDSVASQDVLCTGLFDIFFSPQCLNETKKKKSKRNSFSCELSVCFFLCKNMWY